MQLVISVHNTKKNNSLIFLLLLVLPLFKIFVIFYQFLDLSVPRMHANFCLIIAKFHYTDPTRTGHGQSPRTLSGTSYIPLHGPDTDPNGPNGVSPQKSPCGSVRVRSGPCRVRVVEFSSYPTTCADFVRVGPVSGPCPCPCSGI